jgi:hypothetical protein
MIKGSDGMKPEMVKKQIYLTRDEEKLLIRESFIEGVSQAEVIRRALNSYASAKSESKKGGKRKKDTLYDFVGVFGETEVPEDFSSNIDKYLYGGEED